MAFVVFSSKARNIFIPRDRIALIQTWMNGPMRVTLDDGTQIDSEYSDYDKLLDAERELLVPVDAGSIVIEAATVSITPPTRN